MVRLEGFDKLKTLNDLIGNRTSDLPACSIEPQPSTVSHAPCDLYSESISQSRKHNALQYTLLKSFPALFRLE
jgi:hypothetical protein